MPEWVNQLITSIMPYVVTIVTAIAGYVAIKIKSKFEEKINTETKKEVAEATVKYVQQVYDTLEGKEKFKKALETMLTWLNEKGINITEAEATILIEASVKGFKEGWSNNTLPTCTAGLLQVGEVKETEFTTVATEGSDTMEMNEQQPNADAE